MSDIVCGVVGKRRCGEKAPFLLSLWQKRLSVLFESLARNGHT